MGLQLGINEASNIIIKAIKATAENLDKNFYHIHSAPGHQGFLVEIADQTLETKLSVVSKNYDNGDFIFTLNIPYEYFNDDQLSDDDQLGIKPIDHTEVKAEIRCIDLITKTYESWIEEHDVFTSQDLVPLITTAIIKLRKNLKLRIYKEPKASEIAANYINLNFGVYNIVDYPSYFNLTIPISFYNDKKTHIIDSRIGFQNLTGKSKKDICLLRICYLIYLHCTIWLEKYHKQYYNQWRATKGE